MAAEYVLKEGNPNVMLCERGIRTFETAYRFTLDIMAIPMLKELSHLPVIVDPSHAPGRRDMVLPLSLAAAAAGADGIIVEVHPNPEEAICDGPQQIYADEFARLPRAGRARGGGGRQGPERRRVKVAVVGVGLIGGSIGLAARQRLGAHVSGYDPSAAARETAIARGAIARGRATPSRRRSPAPTSPFVAAPVQALAAMVADGAGGRGAGLRRHRRRLGQARGRRRGRRPALHRRPPAGGRGDRGRRARPRRSVPGRHLVPDADRRSRAGTAYERLHRCITRIGAWPIGDRARHPRRRHGLGVAPPARAGQRARRPGRAGAVRRGRAAARHRPVASATSPAWRARTPSIWGGIYRANADALVAAIDDMVARLTAVRDQLAAGDDDGIARVERRRPRGPPPAARVRPGRRRGPRAARARPEPARDRRRDRAGARAARRSTSWTWASIPLPARTARSRCGFAAASSPSRPSDSSATSAWRWPRA